MKRTMNARAFKTLIAALFAVSASVVPLAQSFAAGETLGGKCPTEGVMTGTKSTSLICTKTGPGKLSWQRVKLNDSNGRPVGSLTPPPGEIEFWHYRPEVLDQKALVQIIASFEAKYPGTKIKQVFKDTTTYNNTARVQILANPKAALFATSRGAIFDQFAKSDMMADLGNQRYVRQNTISKAMFAGQYGGKQLGVPYQYLFNNPIVNTDIWAKEKWTTPKNLSGWVAWCKDAKAKGYTPLAWPGATLGQAAQISNSALMNSAASYAQLAKNLDDLNSGKIDLTSTWFKGVADIYVKLRDAGCFPDNPTGVTQNAAYTLFATGKSPVLPIGTFAMGDIVTLNPALDGKMQLMSMILTDGPVVAEGIMNNTYILSVNKNSSSRDQQIANAFLSYLMTGPVAQIYANTTLQHVNVLDVEYTNINLLATSSFQAKNTMLAPRFLLVNGSVSDLTQQALIAIVGGKSPDVVLPDFSNQIKQKLSA
ncbi:MAG: extracellular solute-binding protein [Actinomycetales bacterium]|nr:extracellular solute-binding protein [Actinomycetales bacterium]